jgi:cbb3-type cytochrome oxidase subunit 3
MCCTQEIPPSLLDTISKISSIIIAIFSLFFTAYIFWYQNKKANKNNADSRKRDSLKTIILEHNLTWLFNFFDNIQTEIKVLNTRILTDSEKETLNEKLQDELKNIRLKFTDLLLAVDKNLYDSVKNSLDDLIDELTVYMFDEGINLTYTPKFEEKITSAISKYKTNIIKDLYNYNKE